MLLQRRQVHRLGPMRCCTCDAETVMGRGFGLRSIVSLRVRDVPMMTLSAGMLVFFTRVHKAFMAYKEVAASECLATEIAHEGFLFCMGANVALEVLLGLCQYTREGIGVPLPRIAAVLDRARLTRRAKRRWQ